MISANYSRCFIGLLKFVFCHDGLRRWREEIWDAVASSGLDLTRRSSHFGGLWRALQPLACSPPPWIGSFLSPYTNQSSAVITAWLKNGFVYSRYRGNCYISDVPKAPPTGRELMCISIIQSAVFVQTNAKIHPHKPVLNNIIIYTSDFSFS